MVIGRYTWSACLLSQGKFTVVDMIGRECQNRKLCYILSVLAIWGISTGAWEQACIVITTTTTTTTTESQEELVREQRKQCDQAQCSEKYIFEPMSKEKPVADGFRPRVHVLGCAARGVSGTSQMDASDVAVASLPVGPWWICPACGEIESDGSRAFVDGASAEGEGSALSTGPERIAPNGWSPSDGVVCWGWANGMGDSEVKVGRSALVFFNEGGIELWFGFRVGDVSVMTGSS